MSSTPTISKSERISFIDEMILNTNVESVKIFDAIYREIGRTRMGSDPVKSLLFIHNKLKKVIKLYSILINEVSYNMKYFDDEIDGRIDSLLSLHRNLINEIDIIQGKL